MGRAHQRLAEALVYEARESWMFDANCIGKQEMFFPGKGESGVANKAKKLCQECPVKPECGEYAEKNDTEYGVWAGKLYQPSKPRP